jgi:putative phosphoribosyl transferase
MFRDRTEAGRRLGEYLAGGIVPGGAETVVLGIPRGGVVVAAPVAEALGSPLDIVVPRKIGAPGQAELAVGAVALAGGEEITLLDEASVARLRVPREYLETEVKRQRHEIERRLEAYREGRPPAALEGRTVVVVDDGLATGLTARAAAAAIARVRPRQVVVAAPVAPPETVREFRDRGLRLEVLETPSLFMAVGQFYGDFHAVEDDEVRAVLRAAARTAPR